MIDCCCGCTPLDSFKSYPTRYEGGGVNAFFISEHAVDNYFKKNLDLIL